MARIVASVNAAGSLLVAPLAGIGKWLSTARYCVGIPRQAEALIVLDFAASIMTEGKCLVISSGGKKLPQGALHDLDGTLSEDPPILYGPYTSMAPATTPRRLGRTAPRASTKARLICKLLSSALTRIGATAPNRHFAKGMLALVPPRYLSPPTTSSAKSSPTLISSAPPSRSPPSSRC